MTTKEIIFTLSAMLMLSTTAGAQARVIKDYVHVPGPVMFGNQAFNLNWSSHPADNFYKQEYIPQGELTDAYKSMVLIDIITGEAKIKDIVSAKVAELKKMKETNPMVNYEMFNKPQVEEYMIDFILTANAADSKKINIVERNVYRYKTFTEKSGKKGIMLFGISTRGYQPGVDQFLTGVKTNRKELVNKVAQFKMPEITVAP